MSVDAESLIRDLDDQDCRESLRHFLKHSWPLIDPGVEYIPSWHIDAICYHLEALWRSQIRNLIINVPPRTGKSTIASVAFPAWCWLQDPAYRFITCSYESTLAVRDSVKSRRLFDTLWYQRLNQLPSGEKVFYTGAEVPQKNLKDTESYYENDRGGTRLAVGIGGPILGQGGNLLSVDDPQKPDIVDSALERVRAILWWDQRASTRLNNPKRDKKLIVQQRTHAGDLTGHELEKNMGYVHLKLPMRYKPASRCVTSLGVDAEGNDVSWEDDRTRENELLCEERFDDQAVAVLEKNLGPYAFAAQEQQEPLPEGGGIWKLGWWQRWDNLPAMIGYGISVDAAFEKTTDGSYVVVQLWGYTKTDDYLLEQIRERLDYTETENAIGDMVNYAKQRGYHVAAKLIERKANGHAIVNRLSKQTSGVIEIVPSSSKEARAGAVAPYIRAGNVWIPRDAPWVLDFLTETSNFPKHTSDDQVDATSQWLNWRHVNDDQVTRAQSRDRFLKWSGVDFRRTSG